MYTLDINNIAFSADVDGKKVTIHPIDECFESLRYRIESKDDTIKNLREENKQLKTELYKDTKIQELTTQLEQLSVDYYRGFPITEEEKQKIEQWIQQHDKEKHGIVTDEQRLHANGCCGGRFTYQFTPTSIGVIGTIICHCGDSFTFQELE